MSTWVEPTRDDAVAVIDNQDAIHAAVELWCSQARPRIRVAGRYFSARQFLAEHPSASESGIGAVVFDLEVESRCLDFGALDRIIRSGHRVIVYSHFATPEVILNSLDLGAVTYLMKSESKDHLIDAIRAAPTDIPYVGPRMAKAMVADRTVGRPNLTSRERQVLIAWVRTESKALVARQLDIGPPTVRTHLQRIRAKYAAVGRPAKTKAALVARAIQDGIVSVHDL